MKFKLVFQFLFSGLLFLFVTACSKNEVKEELSPQQTTDNDILTGISQQQIFDGDILGDWNLLYSTGGRALPHSYNKGEIVWSFDKANIKIVNLIDGYNYEKTYTILDTLGETHLLIGGHYAGNIMSIKNDSLILNAEKYVGCGGGSVLVR